MRKKNHSKSPNERLSSRCARAIASASVIACALVFGTWSEASGQQNASPRQQRTVTVKPVADEVILRIMRAEDERRWDNDLGGAGIMS
jgi:hypothetical protein